MTDKGKQTEMIDKFTGQPISMNEELDKIIDEKINSVDAINKKTGKLTFPKFTDLEKKRLAGRKFLREQKLTKNQRFQAKEDGTYVDTKQSGKRVDNSNNTFKTDNKKPIKEQLLNPKGISTEEKSYINLSKNQKETIKEGNVLLKKEKLYEYQQTNNGLTMKQNYEHAHHSYSNSNNHSPLTIKQKRAIRMFNKMMVKADIPSFQVGYNGKTLAENTKNAEMKVEQEESRNPLENKKINKIIDDKISFDALTPESNSKMNKPMQGDPYVVDNKKNETKTLMYKNKPLLTKHNIGTNAYELKDGQLTAQKGIIMREFIKQTANDGYSKSLFNESNNAELYFQIKQDTNSEVIKGFEIDKKINSGEYQPIKIGENKYRVLNGISEVKLPDRLGEPKNDGNKLQQNIDVKNNSVQKQHKTKLNLNNRKVVKPKSREPKM